MLTPRLVSVVIPAHNEELNIEPFYNAMSAVTNSLRNFEWEFVFVDDGSIDQTLTRILELRRKDLRIRILQLSRNFGSYGAYRAGLEYARGDAVITISVDLQDPPELFVQFLAHWEAGYQTVWAVRAERDDHWTRKALARLFYVILRRLALQDLPVGGMDCGLFDRKVVDAFRKITDRNGITFMTIFWMGFRQAWVSYHRQSRLYGDSKWPLAKRIKAAIDVITLYSYLPIRLASYLGLTVSVVSLVGSAIIIFNKVVWGVGAGGWPSVMVALLFLGGVQLVVLGIMGEYLWRISNEVRGQPQYIIMEEYGFGDLTPAQAALSAVGQTLM